MNQSENNYSVSSQEGDQETAAKVTGVQEIQESGVRLLQCSWLLRERKAALRASEFPNIKGNQAQAR